MMINSGQIAKIDLFLVIDIVCKIVADICW